MFSCVKKCKNTGRPWVTATLQQLWHPALVTVSTPGGIDSSGSETLRALWALCCGGSAVPAVPVPAAPVTAQPQVLAHRHMLTQGLRLENLCRWLDTAPGSAHLLEAGQWEVWPWVILLPLSVCFFSCVLPSKIFQAKWLPARNCSA